MKSYILLLGLLLGGFTAYADSTAKKETEAILIGHVVDSRSGEHLPFITITVKGTTIGTTTDVSGHYLLGNLPVGRPLTVVAQSVGYKSAERSVTLGAHSTTELNFELEEQAVDVGEVVVEIDRNSVIRKETPSLVNILNSKLFERTNAATLADAINKDNEIGTRCPSVLIAGPSNFPARKKAAQVAAWDANRDMYSRAEHYLNLLRRAHCQPIKSNDPEAIEALTYKLNRLQAERDRMKATNAYYRQHKTLEGCPDLDPEERRNIESHWAAGWYTGTPYPPYALQNSLANVKRLQDRLNSLQTAKSATHDDEEHDGYTYHEDTEQMRVQLIFDGKPDDDTRALLKSYGFRWSPRNSAWQRQLTDNGRRSARQLMRELDAANNDSHACQPSQDSGRDHRPGK